MKGRIHNLRSLRVLLVLKFLLVLFEGAIEGGGCAVVHLPQLVHTTGNQMLVVTHLPPQLNVKKIVNLSDLQHEFDKEMTRIPHDTNLIPIGIRLT